MELKVFSIAFSVTQYGLKLTDSEVYENETEIEVCVEVKPPYNNTPCPVDFEFDLQISIQCGNSGKVFRQLQ